jgi:hypothetical protein
MKPLPERFMRTVRWGSLLGAVLLLAGPAARTQQKASGAVNLELVKYDRLAQEVLKHRGKVVVIDMWQIL